MDSTEKSLWVFTLWTESALSFFWLAAGIYGGWGHTVGTSPLIMFPILFAVAFITWLFRITYLRGKGNRY